MSRNLTAQYRKQSLLLSILLGMISSVCADEFTVVPRISTGVLDYSLDAQPTLEVTPDSVIGDDGAEYTDTLPVTSLGVTFARERFYVDINYQETTSPGTDDIIVNNINIDSMGTITSVNSRAKNEFDFKESALTFGYFMTSSTALFIGYREAVNDFNSSFQSTAFNTLLNGTLDSTFTATAKTEYKGPFVGLNQTWPINADDHYFGSIAFKVTLTALESDTRQSGRSQSEGLADIAKNEESGSESIGVNLGASWNGKMGDRVNYHIALDTYNYIRENDFSKTITELVRLTAGVSVPLTM